MTEITEKLKERFCKDMNIPIKIFIEPYFSERLELLDKYYNTIEKYDMFKELLTHFETEESYFEMYNKLKDSMIETLHNDAMQTFLTDNSIEVKYENDGFCSKDVYKHRNKGKFFLSIDMQKANYTSLLKYNSATVLNTTSYEELVGKFTEYEYFKRSKYIRQVVFGNLNPKRQVRWEKHLMGELLDVLFLYLPKECLCFYSNDEVVFDLTHYTTRNNGVLTINVDKLDELTFIMQNILSTYMNGRMFRFEIYKLYKLVGVKGYVREKIAGSEIKTGETKLDFKCITATYLPFIIRYLNKEPYIESDTVFVAEEGLAKLLNVPSIFLDEKIDECDK